MAFSKAGQLVSAAARRPKGRGKAASRPPVVMVPPQPSPQEQSALLGLATDMAGFAADPYGYAVYAFPWGEGELAGFDGPRKWQAKILMSVRDHLSNPATRFKPLRIAVSSGNGIGKSCLISMLTSWALDTCVDARVQITANNEGQLRIKTWPEVTKWKGLAITKGWFDIGATSVRSKDAKHSQSWRADMVTWNIKNPSGFQGLHNIGKRILMIFDEASGIPKEIWEASSGCETDAGTEIIRIAFGNPLGNEGSFQDCFTSQSRYWLNQTIDSRTVEGTNKELFEQWIQTYGEDSDYVRVRVKGIFPRVASTQFIGKDVVAACQKYKAVGHEGLPKILGVDVARFGDDTSRITLRQGRHVRTLLKISGLSTAELAEHVIEQINGESPDAVVVDSDGLGAGTIDHLKYRGYTRGIYEFHGAERPVNTSMYANRRAEVWGLMRDALRAAMEVPDDPECEQDLTTIQYGMNARGQIQLESKKDMKARGSRSPDFGDSLAMTFAVNPLARASKGGRDILDVSDRIAGGRRFGWMN